MDVSKFTAAAVAQTNELQVALASLNFDFALFKVEAPSEYKAVGMSMSPSRKKNAEDGPAHRTARKLDALLGSMVSAPDALLAAYGQRVSEISSSPAFNPQGSRKDGMFQGYVGADSTTIWAAATSGRGAMAVHLLACMLARLWRPTEATSIWAEIIEQRKTQISREFDSENPSHFPLIQASKFDLSRAELASWDASARAWLTVADNAKKHQHSQLRLILEGLSISVNNTTLPFDSVIKAWRSGMEMVESLLKGVSQRVSDGTMLLALSAWHLFPDMDVFCDTNKTVQQRDAIMKNAGRVIVGLEDADPSQSTGIFWSLSLSHLRYYGDPVRCRRSAAQDASRVSFDEFSLVALGGFLQRWCVWTRGGLDIDAVCEMIIAVGDFVGQIDSTFPTDITMTIEDWRAAHELARLNSGWIGFLVKACEMLRGAGKRDRKDFENLFKLGTRRGASFLGKLEGHPPRLFGLTSASTVLRLLTDDEECQIDALRLILSQHPKARNTAVLASYTHRCPRLELSWTELATLVPVPPEAGSQSSIHARWVPFERANLRHPLWLGLGAEYNKTRFDELAYAEEICQYYASDNLDNVQLENQVGLCYDSTSTRVTGAGIPISSGCFDIWPSDDTTIHSASRKALLLPRINGPDARVGIYAKGLSLDEIEVPVKVLSNLVAKRSFDVKKLQHHLTNVWLSTASEGFIRSMRALASADLVYRLMPSAMVSLSVLHKELGERKWVPRSDLEVPYEDQDDDFVLVKRQRTAFERFEIDRLQSFSCVALFETGTMDLPADCFANVMAISSGNSIFASGSILCDPWDDVQPYEVRRLVANIGRPGVAMLMPPAGHRMKEPEFHAWRLINHAPFDDGIKDRFHNTSMHLSFTGYESPVPGTVSHGAQDQEAIYVETLAQVYDGSKWIGDVDILKGLESPLMERAVLADSCRRDKMVRGPRFPAVSIDNWDELVDSPSVAGVVRAHGNAVGRLAAALISIQKNRLTVVLPSKVCWECLETTTRHSKDELSVGIYVQ